MSLPPHFQFVLCGKAVGEEEFVVEFHAPLFRFDCSIEKGGMGVHLKFTHRTHVEAFQAFAHAEEEAGARVAIARNRHPLGCPLQGRLAVVVRVCIAERPRTVVAESHHSAAGVLDFVLLPFGSDGAQEGVEVGGINHDENKEEDTFCGKASKKIGERKIYLRGICCEVTQLSSLLQADAGVTH